MQGAPAAFGDHPQGVFVELVPAVEADESGCNQAVHAVAGRLVRGVTAVVGLRNGERPKFDHAAQGLEITGAQPPVRSRLDAGATRWLAFQGS